MERNEKIIKRKGKERKRKRKEKEKEKEKKWNEMKEKIGWKNGKKKMEKRYKTQILE